MENCKRERDRVRAVLGMEAAPEIDMVYPVEVAFWSGQTSPVAVKLDRIGEVGPVARGNDRKPAACQGTRGSRGE